MKAFKYKGETILTIENDEYVSLIIDSDRKERIGQTDILFELESEYSDSEMLDQLTLENNKNIYYNENM